MLSTYKKEISLVFHPNGTVYIWYGSCIQLQLPRIPGICHWTFQYNSCPLTFVLSCISYNLCVVMKWQLFGIYAYRDTRHYNYCKSNFSIGCEMELPYVCVSEDCSKNRICLSISVVSHIYIYFCVLYLYIYRYILSF